MRKTAMAIAAAMAAAVIAAGAQAQPYGYYTGRDRDYAYRYEPPRAYGYDGRYTPYSYYNGYDRWGEGDAVGLAGALIGGLLAPGLVGHPPYDAYGPDPNGLIGPDGRRIKCKLISRWDPYAGRSLKRRECWPE